MDDPSFDSPFEPTLLNSGSFNSRKSSWKSTESPLSPTSATSAFSSQRSGNEVKTSSPCVDFSPRHSFSMVKVPSLDTSPSMVSSPSGLPNIAESFLASKAVHFTLVGYEAGKVMQTIVHKAQEEFCSSLPIQPFPSVFASQITPPRQISPPETNDGPMSCTVMLNTMDSAENVSDKVVPGEANLSELLEMSSDWPTTETFQTSVRSLETEMVCAYGSSSAASCAGQLVDLYWSPVEKFMHNIPSCTSVEQWRSTCVLFLVDPRMDSNSETSMDSKDSIDVISNLSRRLHEVEYWANSFARTFKITRVLPMMGVVLVHGPASAAVQSRYMEFVLTMRRTLHVPDDCPSLYSCDFDNERALLDTVSQIAAAVLDSRKDYDLWQSLRVEPKARSRSSYCVIQ